MSTYYITVKTEVYCTVQIEGLHCWPSCPFEEVRYLRDPHRHVFHIKAYKHATHLDRDTEFIILKHNVLAYLKEKYYNESKRMCDFGSMSCEMISRELVYKFNLSRCVVDEDGENGAIITVENV